MDRDIGKRDGLTLLLDRLNGGREGAFAELVDAVYADLRQIAAERMRRQFNGKPLESLTRAPTEIADDAVMQLRRQYSKWKNRDQFFAIATRLIHQLVLQYQRQRLAKKAGGGNRGVSLDALGEESDALARSSSVDSPALEAIWQLHTQHPRAAEVVSLHAVSRHTLPEIAELLGISLRTTEREWELGRAWLRRELAHEG